ELERAIGEARRQGDPEARVHVWLGEPHHEIVAAANDLGACLIVMGAHGRKSWQHLMIGSVAERVIRTATVPVLTILPDAVSTWVRSREQKVGART
ncbi:MAG TPA: universal stress protein, partial [Candidatus Polarisedimenticolaceae bacterium]|nr:universal stress protein [Candidatus Polarisedimenticolaceae bacterium]